MRVGGNSTAELSNLYPQMDRQREKVTGRSLRGAKRKQDLLAARAHMIDLMFSNQNFRFQLILVAGAIALLYLSIGCNAFAGRVEEQICDVSADYALGIEDYPETIRLHAEAVRKDPKNALAHYHLGFAQGVMGNRRAEVTEYKRAEALGLKLGFISQLGIGANRKWRPERSDRQSATSGAPGWRTFGVAFQSSPRRGAAWNAGERGTRDSCIATLES